jgi:hypothetical protein
LAPAKEGGKKNDATVPIVIVIGAILLLLLFGGQGCNSISLPSYGPGTGSGGSNPSHYGGYQCDSRRYDCRGHYDGNGRWVADGGGRGERQDSGHEHRKPRPTDDPDPPGER